MNFSSVPGGQRLAVRSLSGKRIPNACNTCDTSNEGAVAVQRAFFLRLVASWLSGFEAARFVPFSLLPPADAEEDLRSRAGAFVKERERAVLMQRRLGGESGGAGQAQVGDRTEQPSSAARSSPFRMSCSARRHELSVGDVEDRERDLKFPIFRKYEIS